MNAPLSGAPVSAPVSATRPGDLGGTHTQQMQGFWLAAAGDCLSPLTRSELPR